MRYNLTRKGDGRENGKDGDKVKDGTRENPIFKNKKQQDEYLGPLRNTKMNGRYYSEKTRDRKDGEFHRDFSRIMYASSFRRLQGKMQLLGIKSDQFFRNRLTHSLEVAQIAGSIAFEAGYRQQEAFVVQAGALAHDIGNPPFGHSGERKLHELFQKVGGFEGNAQTLRILTSLEKKKKDFTGLNLTYRTLLSVVKYFHMQTDENGDTHKKFIYDDDYEMLRAFVDENNVKVRTLDVQIVDVADEIAYAAHDLEDGLRQKCFTMEEILHDFYQKYKGGDSYRKLEKLVKKSKKDCGYQCENNLDSSIYSKLFRQEISSRIIHCLIKDLGICKIGEKERAKRGAQYKLELGFQKYGDLAHGLKDITFRCINHKDDVYTYETKGNKILETLADFYRHEKDFLPPEYRVENYIGKGGRKKDEGMLQERLICDYLAGMMDSYAINCYQKITGESFDQMAIVRSNDE